MYAANEIDLDRAIAERRAELAAFEQGITSSQYLRRLAHEAPLHPYLLAWRGLIAVALSLLVAVAVVMLAPSVSMELARAVMGFERTAGASLPGLLLVGALSTAAAALIARQFAISRGKDSPWLKDELRVRTRLQVEVLRLITERDVRSRLPDPAATLPEWQRLH